MPEALRDPAGLIARAPELATLANADPAVRRALARGDAHAVYRTLWRARWLGRLKAHRTLLDSLLAHRRLFVVPLRRMPVLQTLNGVGASIYGQAEPDSDGTYLKTHFLVLLFMPLVPLSQYLVRDGEKKGRSWFFLGKVPMSPLLWLWNRAVVAALLASLALGAWRTFYTSGHHDVVVVNALPGPVHVAFGSVATDVASNQRGSVSLKAGTYPVKVTDVAGHVIETDQLLVAAGPDQLVWNVAGAAPIYELDVQYHASSSPDQAGPQPVYHCGESGLHIGRVDYAFVEPPHSIQMPTGQAVAVRRQLGLADGGFEACGPLLAERVKPERVLLLVRALALFDDQNPHVITTAVSFCVSARKPDEALTLVRQAVAKHPDSMEHQRLYQSIAGLQGQHEQLLAEYKARLAAAPDSPDAAYLYARLLSHADALALATPLLARFPSHVRLLGLAAFSSEQQMLFKDALAYAERLRQLDAKAWLSFSEDHVTILAALGRAADARTVAEEAAVGADGWNRFRLAGLYAWLSSGDAGDALYGKLMKPAPADVLRFEVRFWQTARNADLRALSGDPYKPEYELMQQLHYDPAAALRLAASMPVRDLRSLGNELLLLLLGESLRTSETGARQALLDSAHGEALPLPEIQAYLEKGASSRPLEDLSLLQQGMLHFVRSRNTALAAGERARLRELANRCDPAGGYVRLAMERWPLP
jgi:hypothetical protein